MSTAPVEQLLLTQRPFILGIGGCSGSGKTTLARELTAQLNATLLALDFCYVCLSHLPAVERARSKTLIIPQFEATAKPMADLYVISSATHSSITVEGTDVLDWSIEQILKRLHQIGLTRTLHRPIA